MCRREQETGKFKKNNEPDFRFTYRKQGTG